MNLFDAIRAGQQEAVATLLEQHPELATQADARGFTPLVMAAYI